MQLVPEAHGHVWLAPSEATTSTCSRSCPSRSLRPAEASSPRGPLPQTHSACPDPACTPPSQLPSHNSSSSTVGCVIAGVGQTICDGAPAVDGRGCRLTECINSCADASQASCGIPVRQCEGSQTHAELLIREMMHGNGFSDIGVTDFRLEMPP
jgi:hypothetical protein